MCLEPWSNYKLVSAKVSRVAADNGPGLKHPVQDESTVLTWLAQPECGDRGSVPGRHCARRGMQKSYSLNRAASRGVHVRRAARPLSYVAPGGRARLRQTPLSPAN